ncbi:hypothetical protein HW555_012380, partial [Spodoptera exigua]
MEYYYQKFRNSNSYSLAGSHSATNSKPLTEHNPSEDASSQSSFGQYGGQATYSSLGRSHFFVVIHWKSSIPIEHQRIRFFFVQLPISLK